MEYDEGAIEGTYLEAVVVASHHERCLRLETEVAGMNEKTGEET